MEKGEKDLKLKVEDMFVAEAFAIQHQIIKSQRRHAREHWATIRHRYVHIYVRYIFIQTLVQSITGRI